MLVLPRACVVGVKKCLFSVTVLSVFHYSNISGTFFLRIFKGFVLSFRYIMFFCFKVMYYHGILHPLVYFLLVFGRNVA